MRARGVAAAVAAILVAQLASAGQRWNSRSASGPTKEEALVREWTDAHLAAQDVIAVVGNGQRIGYYSRRPTLAVPTAMFTALPWDVTTLQKAVQRYGVRLVVSTGEAGTAFFARGIPAWLIPVHQSTGVRIFEVAADTVSRGENRGAR